ncbi:gustatory receptor 28b [Asbolus verrucosus]|uniref:Gustatory receptor n=1 Tax=Asbolus verrucosus TaxID=1661398 RepID=A0A482VL14_ASBVE|nr:gustatory receptor 28b [Asbolus verrucosus]
MITAIKISNDVAKVQQSRVPFETTNMNKITSMKSVSLTHHDSLHEIYRSIRPIYIICRMVGLNSIRFRGNQQLIAENFDYLYFSFFMVVYVLLSAYSLMCLIMDERSVIVGKTMFLIECSVMVTLMLIVVTFTFFTRRIQIKAFDLLSHIDVSFVRNGFALNYRSLLKNNYVILIFMGVSLMARSVLMILTVQGNLAQQLALLVSTLIKALSKYQFVVFVLQLQMRFAKINSVIASFYKHSKLKLVLNPIAKTIPEQLYILCRLHYKLASVTQKINAAFAVQLLFSIAVSLFDVLFQAYCLYYVSVGKTEDATVAYVMAPVIWLVDEMVEIYWLVYACASTSDQANETPTILHELRNNYFDAELEGHIQTYSLQMLHQKVQFSVLGFFVVDYTLIYSIVGAVTTYLVIFIQFDQSSSNQLDSANLTDVELIGNQ